MKKMTDIDKREIQRKIQELREKIEKQKLAPRTAPSTDSSKEPSLSKDSFFYVLEAKSLGLAVGLSVLLLVTLYILEIKTPYIARLTTWLSSLVF